LSFVIKEDGYILFPNINFMVLRDFAFYSMIIYISHYYNYGIWLMPLIHDFYKIRREIG